MCSRQNANDLHVWAAAVRDQDPELRNDGKAANKVTAAASTLNAHAAEWKATAELMYWMVNLQDKILW